jgi:hypothetical protein
MPAETPPAASEDVPPPLGSWSRLYTLVLGALAIEIVGLWVLARAFG